MPERPPMIRTDKSNAFAHNTFAVRVPQTVRDIQQLNPDYPPAIHGRLDRLREEIENNAPIAMIGLPAPDYDRWAAAHAAHAGDTWRNSVWFFAEHFFYRRVIEAVRWWDTQRDPFAPRKDAELATDALWDILERALNIRDHATEERLRALLHNALWGNRIDLSYPMSLAYGGAGHSDDLLADDSVRVVEHLMGAPGDVHIVADNTGTELAMDLALADALLDDAARQLIVHVKMHPTFVSDATVADVLMLLAAMERHGSAAAQLAGRLREANVRGRLRFAPDFYWNSSRLLWDLPPRLQHSFAGAALVIIKGDANHRRLLGDAIWPPATPFAEVTDYFPAPLLALRTMKSDPVVGLPDRMAERLDAEDPAWHINGKRGVIQFRP